MVRRSIEMHRPEGRKNADLLEQVCRREGLSCPQTAYVLATAFHESRLGSWAIDHRGELPADQARYRGRGFARLTGRAGYAEWGRLLDLPLLAEPDLAGRPEVAATILIRGMKEGRFTGRSLADYINDTETDYVGARRVMATPDHPIRVAGFARAYEAELEGISPSSPTTSDVRSAQRQLAVIGWPLAPDGALGVYTTRAIRDFQSGYCHTLLRPDGCLDVATRLAIETCARNDGLASDHFRFVEFRTPGPGRLCETNRVIRVERALLQALETYRNAVDGPVGIEEGYRSIDHNTAIGAPRNSEHVAGRAVHVRRPQLPAEAVRQLGVFTSIGHRRGLAVHLGVSYRDSTTDPCVYPLDGESAASPPTAVFDRGSADATDSGSPLADAGRRSRSRSPVGAGTGSEATR